jgi:hypothetical protein
MRRTVRSFINALTIATVLASAALSAQETAGSGQGSSTLAERLAKLGPGSTKHPYFHRSIDTGSIEYGVANHQGFYVSLDRGKSWILRNAGLP